MNKENFLKNKYFIKKKNNILLDENKHIVENNFNNIISTYIKNLNYNLYVSYYKDNDVLRCKELDFCLKMNCRNKLFNKIVIINETEEPIDFIDNTDTRIIIINNKKRQTYYDFFKISNIYSDEETINVLCNSDIIIGENFDKINLKKDQIFLLERYEIDNNGFHLKIDLNGSDTWIWKGLFDTKLDIGQYYMGLPYCDFKLASDFFKNNFKLKNPMIDLKTYHIHLSGIRNFTDLDKVKSFLYLKLKQSKLDEIFNEKDYIIV